jgi:hypothetical protein
MSDTAPDTSDRGAPDVDLHLRPVRQEPLRTQRDLLERAFDALADWTDVDPDESRFVKAVTGSGEILKIVFHDGDTWWVTAVRNEDR